MSIQFNHFVCPIHIQTHPLEKERDNLMKIFLWFLHSFSHFLFSSVFCASPEKRIVSIVLQRSRTHTHTQDWRKSIIVHNVGVLCTICMYVVSLELRMRSQFTSIYQPTLILLLVNAGHIDTELLYAMKHHYIYHET